MPVYHTHLDTGADMSEVVGAIPPYFLCPDFDGHLFSLLLFGNNYAPFSPYIDAEGFGAAFDHSGRGNAVSDFLDLAPNIDDWWTAGIVSANEATTNFTSAQLAAGGSCSIFGIGKFEALAKTVSVIRTNDAGSPSMAITVAPSTQDFRVDGKQTSGTLGRAQYGTMTVTELDNWICFGGVWTLAQRTAYLKHTGEDLRVATDNTVLTDFASAHTFDIMDEAGAQSGANFLGALAFIDDARSQDDFLQFVDTATAWLAAVEAGITL
jgi:hypothetical protein